MKHSDPGPARSARRRLPILVVLLAATVAAVFWGADAGMAQRRLVAAQGALLDASGSERGETAGLEGSDTAGSAGDMAVSAEEDATAAAGWSDGADGEIADFLAALAPVPGSLADPAGLVPSLAERRHRAAYMVAEGELEGAPQRVHVLCVDPAAPEASFRPVLSFDRLFGYETLSVMAERAGALAMVNGGFSWLDGRPSGTVLIDGTFWHGADERFPSLLIGASSAALVQLGTEVRVTAGETAGVTAGETVLGTASLNPWPMAEGISVFTPAYGRTDRMERERFSVTISGGVVRLAGRTAVPAEIPADGFVLAADVAAGTPLERMCAPGETVRWEVVCDPPLPEGILHGLSCGSWLVRDGAPCAPDSDPWVGPLAGPAPRTAVGIGPEGQLVFVVAEGRIEGGPSGLSGKTLAKLLADMGLASAALLDGGASSELIVDGSIRNRLSAGRERVLPDGFALVPRR